MNFKNKLNEYLKMINCSSKELSIKSKVSESVISRYRNGERTPKENSEQLKKICRGIEIIIDEKNLTNYKDIDFYKELSNTLIKKDSFNYESFSNNLNKLIITLKININEMSKYIIFDASHISRIRYGKTKPADPISFCSKVSSFIASKYNDYDSLKKISFLVGKKVSENKLYEDIFDYLSKNKCDNSSSNNYIKNFLNSLNKFNLNDYIKAIKFDELKIPNIPFYKMKSKKYYGLEEMKKGELDFFKAVVLSKSQEDIFMCSDMQMDDMASDVEFGKKWMFAIAMCLKKGLHLNIIHNLDRPFNEMMLGLESWIPIYMTGQVSPFYLNNSKNSTYEHLNYTSGNYALCGECIKGYHKYGKYYLANSTKEVTYYKNKANFLLKKANSLMDIYSEKEKDIFESFISNDAKINCKRKRILNSLPLFTIDDDLLDKILKRNKIPKSDIKKIKEYKLREKNNITNILKDNKIVDIVNDCSEKTDQNELYLSLENIFYKKEIKYTHEEYMNQLSSTIKFKNKNYKVIKNSKSTFKNISITILENNYVIISKNSSPTIHFVIRHPKLVNAINNFNPLVVEK